MLTLCGNNLKLCLKLNCLSTVYPSMASTLPGKEGGIGGPIDGVVGSLVGGLVGSLVGGLVGGLVVVTGSGSRGAEVLGRKYLVRVWPVVE